jgi:hypothetical protein
MVRPSVRRCGENDAGEKGKNEKQNKKKKNNSHRGNIHMTGSASAYQGKRKRSVLKRKC